MAAKIRKLTIVLCAACCLTPLHADDDRLLWNWLVEQANDAPFEELTPFRAVYTLLEIAKHCDAMNRREIADHFLRRAEKIVERSEKPSYYSRLFNYAAGQGRLELAEEYLRKAGSSDYLFDSLDLAKFRAGDKEALKNFPREESTFSNALGLVDAYIKVGDYKAVEEFVSDLKISEENDPKDVAGVAFKRIAKLYRDKGDLKNARLYADKAMEVAGNNYYTGFSIRVLHKSLHGALLNDVDKLANLAVAYRGHHTRELLQHLIGELVVTGQFGQAKKVSTRFPVQKDSDRSLRSIAAAQARAGQIAAATETASMIKDEAAKDVARLDIAKALWQSVRKGPAEELVESVYRNSLERDEQDKDLQSQLAHLFALMGRKTKLAKVFEQAESPIVHCSSMLGAYSGYAESEVKEQ